MARVLSCIVVVLVLAGCGGADPSDVADRVTQRLNADYDSGAIADVVCEERGERRYRCYGAWAPSAETIDAEFGPGLDEEERRRRIEQFSETQTVDVVVGEDDELTYDFVPGR